MSCWERDFLIKALEECAALTDLWIPCIDSYRVKEEALFHVVGGWDPRDVQTDGAWRHFIETDVIIINSC